MIPESPAHEPSRHVERSGVIAEHEVCIRGEHDAAELEGECVGVFVGGELASSSAVTIIWRISAVNPA